MARGNRRERPAEGSFGARLYDAHTLWIGGPGAGDWRDEPFANAVGSTPGSLSPWWDRLTAPNAHDVILRIAKATGTDPGWLAYGKDCQAQMRKKWPKVAVKTERPAIPASEAIAAQKAARTKKGSA